MKAPACPRCESTRTLQASQSPVEGKFLVYRCENCNYVWRSTEDLTGIRKFMEEWRKTANTSMLKH